MHATATIRPIREEGHHIAHYELAIGGGTYLINATVSDNVQVSGNDGEPLFFSSLKAALDFILDCDTINLGETQAAA